MPKLGNQKPIQRVEALIIAATARGVKAKQIERALDLRPKKVQQTLQKYGLTVRLLRTRLKDLDD